MKKLQWFMLLGLMVNSFLIAAQPDTGVHATSLSKNIYTIDRSKFFTDEKPVELTIVTDFKKMQTQKVKGVYQNATITLAMPESEGITEDVQLYARGEFRRKNCGMPGIMLNFKNPTSQKLSALKKLKLVCACGSSVYDQQLLLTEYLIYKMYNLITDMSFRVRLAKVNYTDSRSKFKTYTQYAFLIEDIKDLAARNGCKEVKNKVFLTEKTNRSQMTVVAIFEYMIGNTDWAVPNNHNIRLLRPVNDSTAMPYVVPYDFDFSGLVNAPYASPSEELDIKNVTERSYRGFPRTMDEVESVLDIFRNEQPAIMALVNNFDLIQKKDRGILSKYLEEFYAIISNKNMVKETFILGARVQ